MITLIALAFFIPLSLIAGMMIEWRSGQLDHWIRRISPPIKFPTPQPVRTHDEFLDDCEQFNRTMIKVPVDQRVFEAPDTVQ